MLFLAFLKLCKFTQDITTFGNILSETHNVLYENEDSTEYNTSLEDTNPTNQTEMSLFQSNYEDFLLKSLYTRNLTRESDIEGSSPNDSFQSFCNTLGTPTLQINSFYDNENTNIQTSESYNFQNNVEPTYNLNNFSYLYFQPESIDDNMLFESGHNLMDSNYSNIHSLPSKDRIYESKNCSSTFKTNYEVLFRKFSTELQNIYVKKLSFCDELDRICKFIYDLSKYKQTREQHYISTSIPELIFSHNVAGFAIKNHSSEDNFINDALYFNLQNFNDQGSLKNANFKKMLSSSNDFLKIMYFMLEENDFKHYNVEKEYIIWILNSKFMIFIDLFLPEFFNLRKYICQNITKDTQQVDLCNIKLLLKILIEKSINTFIKMVYTSSIKSYSQTDSYKFYCSKEYLKESLFLRTIVGVICKQLGLEHITLFLRHITKQFLILNIKDNPSDQDLINFLIRLGEVIIFNDYDELTILTNNSTRKLYKKNIQVSSIKNLISCYNLSSEKDLFIFRERLCINSKAKIKNDLNNINDYFKMNNHFIFYLAEKDVIEIIKAYLNHNITYVWFMVNDFQKSKTLVIN